MSDYEINCNGCVSLKNVLNQKEEEIQNLKLEIQNLTEVISKYKIQSERCDFCLNSNHYMNDGSSPKSETTNTDTENLHHSHTGDVQNNDSPAISKQDDDESNSPISKELYENLNHNDDYIYDEQSQMYYSVSTGFYYDTNTELFYVPQTDSYYKYDYSKHKYEVHKKNEKTVDVKDACNHVAEKVVNLNISDSANISVSNSERLTDERSSLSSQSQTSPVQKHYTININLTGEVVQPQTRNTDNEVPEDSSTDWLPPEGSNATVKDLVTEVAEQSSGMSDYIYDEKCSMYYCRSNGNYYDPIRKLLYDPRARIYYLYIQETLSYEFYCKADAISDINGKEAPKKPVTKAEARKKFWKKKQKESTKKKEDTKKDSSDIKGDSNDDQENSSDIKEDSYDNQENSSDIKEDSNDDQENSSDIKEDSYDNQQDSFQQFESNVNEGFSSPEAGEIFSSDSESELVKENQVTPVAEEPSPPCPPCIRAVVEKSSKIKIGSLLLITCTGAIIGRERSNTISLPEISVSKKHAELTFDNESWTYRIEDLGSQNGTFVNEVRLSEAKQKSEPHALSHGDKLSLGSCKLLIHIHEGYETCDQCEPGQVMAELASKEVKVTPAFKTKKEKEKERKREMKRLKKKYGLQGMEYGDGKNCVPSAKSGYEDKAEIRRKTVGSQNPYEKTEVASMDTSMSESNKGYQMLKKLGWKEGDSLGLKNSGISDPIPIRPWLSKAGLGSTEAEASKQSLPEDRRKRKWIKAQERYFQLSS